MRRVVRFSTVAMRIAATTWILVLFGIGVLDLPPGPLLRLVGVAPPSREPETETAASDGAPAATLSNEDLVRAAATGDVKRVADALDAGLSPAQPNAAGHIALTVAAADGRARLVALLLERGALVDRTDRVGRTALLRAIARGHVAIVQALLSAGASPDIADAAGITALHVAAGRHPSLLRAALEHSKAVDRPDGAGRTALHVAVESGRAENAELLLARGANPNAQDGWGQTPLMRAAGDAENALVPTLMAARADLHARDLDGHTALDHALANGHSQALRIFFDACADRPGDARCTRYVRRLGPLLERSDGASVQVQRPDEANAIAGGGPSVIDDAILGGYDEAAIAEIAAGAPTELRDPHGRVPLHLAAMRSRILVAEALIAAGGGVDMPVVGGYRRKGWTALMIAAAAGDTHLVDVLLDSGARIEQRNDRGRTALFFALLHRHDDVAGQLLRAGADADTADVLGIGAREVGRLAGNPLRSPNPVRKLDQPSHD